MAPPTCVVDHARTAKCPELLCPSQALLMTGWCPAPPRRALPLLPCSYELMRQTSSLLRNSRIHTYLPRSLQVAAILCWEPVLPDVISASLSQDARAIDPVGWQGAYACSFPYLVGLPQVPPMGRLPRIAPQRDFVRPVSRSSLFLTFRPPGLLATQVSPTGAPTRRRAAVTFPREQTTHRYRCVHRAC